MRNRRVCLLLLLLILNVPQFGCKPRTSRKQALEQRLQAIRDQVQSFEKAQVEKGVKKFPDVIVADAEYYVDGPQQARSPDGKFAVGTKVRVMEKAGSYVRVESTDGIEAYVAADAVEQSEEAVVDDAAIVTGENRFAIDLYRQLPMSKGNVFFSPSSITVALAMTYAGAGGATKAEMAKTLHFEVPDEALHAAMKTLLERWTSMAPGEGVELAIANRLWGEVGDVFLPRFLQVARDDYAADLGRVDFEQTEAARQTINSWVASQTKNKITDLFADGAISADTKLVLANAIYFRGTWAAAFDSKQTRDADFHTTATDVVKVPMMRREGKFSYGEADDLKLLELPYGAGAFSMIVLLPKKNDGLARLDRQLTVAQLQHWTDRMKPVDKVRVYLPKFQVRFQLDLKERLQSLGMKSAFDPNAADFSALSADKDLFISAAMHKAFVEVNEQGTEAAAATGVAMGVTAMPAQQPTPVFRADHPFVFLIRDNPSGAILFIGRLVDPTR